MRLTLHVFGTPAPQGSKRHVGGGRMVESSQKVTPWREAVKAVALAETYDQALGPIHVDATYFLARPKSHYRTGTNAHLLRSNAPHWPATKPDLDKLLRSTLDALTDAGIWRDDSQVVSVTTHKEYADHRPPGARLMVSDGATP